MPPAKVRPGSSSFRGLYTGNVVQAIPLVFVCLNGLTSVSANMAILW